MKIREKILSLIPKQEVKEIKVPDLKQYLVNGYEEIRQVKSKNIELENELEEERKNKQLYEGALVTLSEFKQRDEENKREIERLKNKNSKKDSEIYDLNNELNTYRIKKKEIEDELFEIKKQHSLAKEKETQKIKEKIKESLCYKIKNLKGHLSKEKIIEIISKEAE